MFHFVRTTKAFPEEAKTFLRGEAGLVCHVIGSKIPKTLDEIVEGCHSYHKQWGKETVAYSLLRLLEFGLVGIASNDDEFSV